MLKLITLSVKLVPSASPTLEKTIVCHSISVRAVLTFVYISYELVHLSIP